MGASGHCHQARSARSERTTPDRAPAWTYRPSARSGVGRSGGSVQMHPRLSVDNVALVGILQSMAFALAKENEAFIEKKDVTVIHTNKRNRVTVMPLTGNGRRLRVNKSKVSISERLMTPFTNNKSSKD